MFLKKKCDKVIIFLNLTVLFLSLNNLQAIITEYHLFDDIFLLKKLLIPWYLLIFPMFYAFTTHYLQVQDKVKDFLKPSLVIFIAEIALRLCFISYDYYTHAIHGNESSLMEDYTRIEDVFNLMYALFLFFNACLLIFRRHQLISFVLSFDDLSWIKWFIRLGAIVILIWVIALSLDIKLCFGVNEETCNEIPYLFLRLSSSILLYWIGYQGVYKYNVLRDRIVLRSTLENESELITSPNVHSGTSETDDFFNEKHENDFNTIKSHILKNKLYLDPLLSMEAVAAELGMSKSYFSKLINSYSDYNFSDFINSLRVAQAKRFLSDDTFSDYTIVAIGLECGFNSKSTFYSAFKKFTSETPTSYREQF
ncbi:helix-turn-helix domain-containing protein [Gaetbulibacter sp. M240]|uniref:helix-turn-helix domain-containing protein n=1 Tax=Gaetbulibacter sp. M240 TaxID=3126511 RepID=UPI00374EFEBE